MRGWLQRSGKKVVAAVEMGRSPWLWMEFEGGIDSIS